MVRRSSALPVSPCTGVAEIQRVLHVARGMLGRHVQRVEAVPLVFDFRPFDDREAHAREDRLPCGRARASADGDGRARGTRPGSVTSTAPAGRASAGGRSPGSRSSAPRSPASARWRSGRCASSGRAAALAIELHPRRDDAVLAAEISVADGLGVAQRRRRRAARPRTRRSGRRRTCLIGEMSSAWTGHHECARTRRQCERRMRSREPRSGETCNAVALCVLTVRPQSRTAQPSNGAPSGGRRGGRRP